MLISPLLRQYFVVITANLCTLSTGVGLTWPSPSLVKLANATTSPLDRPTTEYENSWILSIGSLAAIVSSFIAGPMADHIGRKNTLLLSCLPKLVGWLLICFATNVEMLLAARFLHGFTDVITLTGASVYASEISSSETRGAMGTILQVMSTTGLVLTLAIGPFLEFLTLGIFGAVVTLLCAAAVFPLPESPYYSHSKGKKEQALRTLTFLRGSEVLAAECIKEFESQKKEKPKMTELIRSSNVVRGVILVGVLGFGVQFTGFNAISFTLQSVLESTGTNLSSAWSSVAISIAQLLASLPTPLFSDRCGRKPILVVTLMAMCTGLFGLGTFFKLVETEHAIEGFLQYLPLVSILLVVVSFSGGVGSLCFPLMAELFSDETRGSGMSVGMFFTTISNFLTLRFFASLLGWLGSSVTYFIFGVNAMFLSLFILIFIPETKGKSFSEIQKSLGEK